MGLKVRASSLPNLLCCPKMWTEKTSHDGDTLGGAEAQTGNLVHLAMNVYHASKKRKTDDRIAEAVAAMKDSKLTHFTGGDLATAESLFHSWYCREISVPKGEVVGSEIELSYKWPIFYSAAEYSAHREAAKSKSGTQGSKPKGNIPLPIAQEEARITGHVDEIRKVGNAIYICDEKTGWTKSDKMNGYYAAQIAAYVVGVKLSGMFPDATDYRGYIKRTRDLQGTSDPYYYEIIKSYEQAEEMMLVVGLRLGEIAQGVTVHVPGEHCRFCPMAVYPLCLDGRIKPPDAPAAVRDTEPVKRNARPASKPLVLPSTRPSQSTQPKKSF